MQSNANVIERTTEWHEVDWQRAYHNVRNLRRRIFKATESKDWRKVRNLQRLMLRSYSNVLLAVRKATQDNKGRKTAGVDKLLVRALRDASSRNSSDFVKTPRKRGQMVDDLINTTKTGNLNPLEECTYRNQTVKNARWEYRQSGTGAYKQL